MISAGVFRNERSGCKGKGLTGLGRCSGREGTDTGDVTGLRGVKNGAPGSLRERTTFAACLSNVDILVEKR